MPLVTNFERDENGQYLSIEQLLDGQDIPEGSTFVAFDSVKFAQATGQVAIADIEVVGTVTGSVLNVDNKDKRWRLWATIKSNTNLQAHYLGLGPAMIEALRQHGIEQSELTADFLRVKQRVDGVKNIDYIGDGPMELTSDSRCDDGFLPAPYSDVAVTPEGAFLTAVRTNLDPSDHLLL